MHEGLLLVNKPIGVTSHDVVQLVRRKLSIRRIGHTGTLDPMAQGLLILLVGAATKHQQAFQGHEKTYEAVLRLGTQTDTGDAMWSPLRAAPIPALNTEHVSALLASFQGPLAQTPPAYSAVKIHGRPAYWWARRHQPVELSARMVHLFEITLRECHADTIAFRVRCSAGTYIRVLAEAIAERLGTVGHLSQLMRVRIGTWSVEDAHTCSWIAQAGHEAIVSQLHPLPATHQPGAVLER